MRWIVAVAGILLMVAGEVLAQVPAGGCEPRIFGTGTNGGFGCEWVFDGSTGGLFAIDSNDVNKPRGCFTFEENTTQLNPSPKFNLWVDFKEPFGCSCKPAGTVQQARDQAPEPENSNRTNLSAAVGGFQCVRTDTDPVAGTTTTNAAVQGRIRGDGSIRATIVLDDGTSGLAECIPDRFCDP